MSTPGGEPEIKYNYRNGGPLKMQHFEIIKNIFIEAYEYLKNKQQEEDVKEEFISVLITKKLKESCLEIALYVPNIRYCLMKEEETTALERNK